MRERGGRSNRRGEGNLVPMLMSSFTCGRKKLGTRKGEERRGEEEQ